MPRPDTRPALTDAELRHLLDDARLLLDRYRRRNEPGRALTPEERRAWAAETVQVMGKLGHVLAAAIGPPDHRAEHERKEIWLEQFRHGLRGPKPIPSDPDEIQKPAMPKWRQAFKRH